jgi:hypothetical protein
MARLPVDQASLVLSVDALNAALLACQMRRAAMIDAAIGVADLIALLFPTPFDSMTYVMGRPFSYLLLSQEAKYEDQEVLVAAAAAAAAAQADAAIGITAGHYEDPFG